MDGEELDRLLTALQDATRRQILVLLLRDGQPRTVDEVAGLVRVHRTVAFDHLERLANLGYLGRSKRRGRIGKPATLYAASDRSLSATYPTRRFVLLARLLAEGLAGLGSDGVDLARRTGRRLGEELATQRVTSAVDALASVGPLGADYRIEDDRVVAGNCVFLEACAAAPAVVCGLHSGILEGALRSSGVDVEVQPQGTVGPSSCAFLLTMS